jgi:hypothetical protein
LITSRRCGVGHDPGHFLSFITCFLVTHCVFTQLSCPGASRMLCIAHSHPSHWLS